MYDYILHVAILACIYGLVALSLNMQAGVAGLMNFGQIAFFGIGAYATAILVPLGWPGIAAMLVGMVVASFAAFIIARLGRTLSADYWAIVTLAVAEILRMVALNESWLTGGAQGISGIPGLIPEALKQWDQLAYLLLCLGCVLVALLVCRRVTESVFGRGVRLMREEPYYAVSLGYDLVALRRSVLMLGAVIASLAGSLFAHYLSFTGPDQLLAGETFLIWTMIMIGGLGNHFGVLLGAVLVQALYSGVPFLKDYLQISSDMSGALRLFIIGLTLLGCLLVRKDGLFPERLRRISRG